jgi:hypothetical protein
VVPRDVVSRDVVPRDVVPRDVVPRDVIPRDVVPCVEVPCVEVPIVGKSQRAIMVFGTSAPTTTCSLSFVLEQGRVLITWVSQGGIRLLHGIKCNMVWRKDSQKLTE